MAAYHQLVKVPMRSTSLCESDVVTGAVTERALKYGFCFQIHHPLTPDQGAPGVTYQLAKHFEGRGSRSRILSFSVMPASVCPEIAFAAASPVSMVRGSSTIALAGRLRRCRLLQR